MAESVTTTATEKVTACYHCGQACDAQRFSDGDRLFCCAGCLSVYHLLKGSHLDGYYHDDATPGLRPASEISVRHAYLDDPTIQARLLDYQDAERSRVHFRIPQMHCAACVWLLERLFQVRQGILKSEVNFPERTVTIIFRQGQISLRQVVELLANLGYEPQITLDSLDRKINRNPNVRLYARIGVAGFAFANIMLFSLPEYFSGGLTEHSLSLTFRIASLLLATPVLLYSASDYFRSAYQGLRERFVNLDVPLSLGIGMLYFRSLFDIVTNAGPGYLDSFTGLVFFLLLGRMFQQKTYDRLSFERDYRSYFPISAIKNLGSEQTTVPITELKPGDHIIVRNQELVPADGVLLNGPARLDYSFVTGEAAPQPVEPLQKVFAGGRQIGGAIELEVIRAVSQSYLVGLWGSQNLPKDRNRTTATLANSVGLWFTVAVLLIAAGAAAYWSVVDSTRIMFAVTSVLIVACPCALALSSPFVLGTASRLWGKHGLFVRTPVVVESMSTLDSIVFDKTGTLTHSSDRDGRFAGDSMSECDRRLVYSLVSQSTHPVSRAIAQSLAGSGVLPVSEYREYPGEGISATVDGHNVQVGRAGWLAKSRGENARADEGRSTEHTTHIVIDGVFVAEYLAASQFREGIREAAQELKQSYAISVMSGDTSREETAIRDLLGDNVAARFGCSPHDKLDGIAAMTSSGNRVLMVGDGLNDAGALQAATVGIAVTADSSAFTPACDAILEANSLRLIPRFVAMARRCRSMIWWSFALSFLYNAIGLSFAVTGHLSPVVSAILMPISSVSVVLFAVLSTRWAARREGLS
jgi:P-type Cu+ transporter